MENNSLAIILLNWNGADDTILCLDSLLDQRDVRPDIIVIDNNSSDNSVLKIDQYIKGREPRVHFIKNEKNLGFAGGINVGLKYALEKNYAFIGTLNSDAVANETWCSALVLSLQRHSSLVISTGILAQTDKLHLDTTGEQYSTWGIPASRGRGELITNAPKSSGYIFASTGGGFIARSQFLKEVGLFDEDFFMYFEDVDLCFRAQLFGYKVYYSPDALAYHKIGASSKKVRGLTTYQTFKNLPLLFWKNVPAALIPVIGIRFILLYTLIFLNAIKNGSGWPALKGLIASIGYFWTSALWKRFTIQRNKKVSTKYIWSILYHDLPPDQTGMRKFRKIFTGKN